MPQTLVKISCEYCHTTFERRLASYNQKKKLGQRQYCSHSCAKKANPKKEKDVAERFWAKVKKTDTCWIWTAGTVNGGYGAFWYQGEMMRANRFSYMLHYGEISDEIEVMHKCDNPPCVRPDHLVAGTHLDNMLDMKAKGRSGVGDHVHGETNGSAKLKVSDVMAIRARLANGEKHKDIAKDFQVARTTITAINRNQNWIIGQAES